MTAVIRFVLYSFFSSLAKLFIDREVKRHSDTIFQVIDSQLPQDLGKTPAAVAFTIESAIKLATGLASVDTRQVQQVRDMFDPIKFIAGRVK